MTAINYEINLVGSKKIQKFTFFQLRLPAIKSLSMEDLDMRFFSFNFTNVINIIALYSVSVLSCNY